MASKKRVNKNGIAIDMTDSPYKEKIYYTSSCFVIYSFSSELYRRNFIARLHENREKINESLSNRFGFKVQNDALCDLKLYTSIEKRGFFIRNNREAFKCQKSIILDGKNVTTLS